MSENLKNAAVVVLTDLLPENVRNAAIRVLIPCQKREKCGCHGTDSLPENVKNAAIGVLIHCQKT